MGIGRERLDGRLPCGLAAILVLSVLIWAAAAGQSAASPVVRTSSGLVEGRAEGIVRSFKGIPYAAPPIGDLRWRAPMPPAQRGLLKADAFGPACIQPPSQAQDSSLGPAGRQSEDCLTLNVWSPNPGPTTRLPVMVWIHGGAFVSGAGGLAAYDGSALASQGAVVVTLNYRLGALGFFSHQALDMETPGGPVNFGLLDQIAALQWVRENISAFGGDPRNVTIFGESAGAQSVLALLVSPPARGLFHKAIAQSPYGLPSHSRSEARKTGENIASELGLDGAAASASELRAVEAERFAGLVRPEVSLAPSLVFGDGVLPDSILDRFERNLNAPVPLIIGNNSNEGSVASLFNIDHSALLKTLGAANIVVPLLFPEARDDEELALLVLRDSVFGAFGKRIADLHSRRADVWRYYFGYLPEAQSQTERGVPHGGEIVFVMNTLDRAPAYRDSRTRADEQMARRVSAYWLAFARTGRPGPEGQPVWEASSRSRSMTLELAESPQLRRNFHERRLNILITVIKMLGGVYAHRRTEADAQVTKQDKGSPIGAN
jgi:para-nitrobenzyl esterase